MSQINKVQFCIDSIIQPIKNIDEVAYESIILPNYYNSIKEKRSVSFIKHIISGVIYYSYGYQVQVKEDRHEIMFNTINPDELEKILAITEPTKEYQMILTLEAQNNNFHF